MIVLVRPALPRHRIREVEGKLFRNESKRPNPRGGGCEVVHVTIYIRFTGFLQQIIVAGTRTFREPYMDRKRLSLAAVAACLASASPSSAQVKMGVAGPLTGPNAAFGAQLKNGAELAVADINAAGGILGQQITLGLRDDVSEPKQALSVADN